jgi:hypothetical protein
LRSKIRMHRLLKRVDFAASEGDLLRNLSKNVGCRQTRQFGLKARRSTTTQLYPLPAHRSIDDIDEMGARSMIVVFHEIGNTLRSYGCEVCDLD